MKEGKGSSRQGRQNKGTRRRKNTLRFQEVSRSARTRTAWLLLVGATACVVVGVVAAGLPWDKDSRSETGVKGQGGEKTQQDARLPTASAQTLVEPAAAPPVPIEPPTTPAYPAGPSTRPVASLAGRPDAPSQPAFQPPLTAEAITRETIEVAEKLLEDFPGSSDAMGLMGMVHGKLGNSAEALRWWEKCIERNPNRADAYDAMGKALLNRGDHQQAAECFRNSIRLDPRRVRVHEYLAEALINLGDPAEAIVALEEEIAIYPEASRTHYVMGQAHLQLQEHQKAAESYLKALERTPDDPAAYYGLATAHARLGHAEKAREYRDRFAELRAKEDERSDARRREASDLAALARIAARTHTLAGNVYRGHRQLEKAERHWRRAAALDAKNSLCRERLVMLYRQSGRRHEALQFCEELREIDPQNATYHLNAGVALADLRHFDAAEKALRQAIELAPERPAAYRTLVQVLTFTGRDLPGAEQSARKLVSLEPTAQNYVLLSQACEQNGDLAAALAAIERAADLHPGSEPIQKVRVRLQQKQAEGR